MGKRKANDDTAPKAAAKSAKVGSAKANKKTPAQVQAKAKVSVSSKETAKENTSDTLIFNDDEQKKAKVPYLLLLRVAFTEELAKKFKDQAGWVLPTNNEIQDPKANNKNFEVKHNDDGCDFKLNDETAEFQLKSDSEESINALNNTVGAYVGAYNKWLSKCKEKAPNKDRELIFDLTVYDEEQIAPFAQALADLGKSFSKITVIDPKTKEEKQLTAEEIAAYTPQAKTAAKKG